MSTPDPIAGAGATQLSWVHANHMGVPLRYSDAAGQTLTLPNNYSIPGFPGQSQTFSDLYYNRYRDYDSSTGRYTQADPIGLAGGPSPYSYAMNNPLRYTDPTGEFVPAVIAFCLTPAGAVACGAVAGAATDLAIQAGSNWWNGRDVFNEDCYDWSQVAMSGGIGGLTGGAGAWLLRGGRAAATAGGSSAQKDSLWQLLLEATSELSRELLAEMVKNSAQGGLTIEQSSSGDRKAATLCALFGQRPFASHSWFDRTVISRKNERSTPTAST